MTIDKDISELTAEELDVVTGGITNNIEGHIVSVADTISDDSTTDLKNLVKGGRYGWPT